MDFFDADRETQERLVRDCFNPILEKKKKRIDLKQFIKCAEQDTTVSYSIDMVKQVCFDALDFFASGEIGEDVVTEDICKKLEIQVPPIWLTNLVSSVRTHCLKEITALKLSKYAFDLFPYDTLKEMVANKIAEPNTPIE